jgi:hypothetical protein
MQKWIIILSVFIITLGPLACRMKHTVEIAPVEVKPIEIKPIHITIDVNVRIDRALDDFFSDIDKAKDTIQQNP